MRTVLKSIILIMLLATVVGCVPKTTSFSPVAIQNDKALVYIYRPNSFLNSAETMFVYVNGKKIGTLWRQQHIYTYVQPGDSLIVLKKNVWPNNEYGRISLRDLQPGKAYYIQCDPIALGGFTMQNMPEAQGIAEISKTLYFIPE